MATIDLLTKLLILATALVGLIGSVRTVRKVRSISHESNSSSGDWKLLLIPLGFFLGLPLIVLAMMTIVGAMEKVQQETEMNLPSTAVIDSLTRGYSSFNPALWMAFNAARRIDPANDRDDILTNISESAWTRGYYNMAVASALAISNSPTKHDALEALAGKAMRAKNWPLAKLAADHIEYTPARDRVLTELVARIDSSLVAER